MQSKQVDSERLHTYKITSNPTNATRKPHTSLDNIQLFSNLKTRNSYLINIELLINDRFLRLYAIKIKFSRQINTHLSPFSRTMM